VTELQQMEHYIWTVVKRSHIMSGVTININLLITMFLCSLVFSSLVIISRNDTQKQYIPNRGVQVSKTKCRINGIYLQLCEVGWSKMPK
jgi:hypothetical protein